MLELRDISKTYDGKPLLNGVSFEVKEGETVCLLGPSGSGKSTLLRIVAGLEMPDGGQVYWNGKDLGQTPVHRRGFGLMFQDYALFPHRNVSENVGFGLRMQGLPREEIEERVRETLEQVNLLEFSRRKVTDLSGGEQQRVALGRALAARPHLLMLDEPMGALDRNLREQLSRELRAILRSTRIPTIYVTHDQEEAFSIADRLVLLHDGEVTQEGHPAEINAAPASAWVVRFFGLGSLLEGEVVGDKPLRVRADGCMFTPECKHVGHGMGEKVTLLVRPAPVEVLRDGGMGEEDTLEGVVEDVLFKGSDYRVDMKMKDGTGMYFLLGEAYKTGERIGIRLKPGALLCLGRS